MSFQATFVRDTVTYIMEEKMMWGLLRKKGEERLQGQKIAKIIFANKTENTEQWTIQIIFIWHSMEK